MKPFIIGLIAVLALSTLLIWMLPEQPDQRQEVVDIQLQQDAQPEAEAGTTATGSLETDSAAQSTSIIEIELETQSDEPKTVDIQIETGETIFTPPATPDIHIDPESGPVETIQSGILDETATETSPTEPPPDRWVVHNVQAGDTLSSIFSEMEISKKLVYNLAKTDKDRKGITRLMPGQQLLLRFTPEDDLNLLIHEQSQLRSTHYTIQGDEIAKEIKERQVELRLETVQGTITQSLFADGQRTGLSNKVIMQLASIFNYDIDFAREVAEGDHFSVIFETQYIDGNLYDSGNVIAAEFINRGKQYRVLRYEDSDGKVDYLNEKGQSRKKAFIRTPLNFTRISSVFSNGRFHPVLKRWRAHKGVDYAAPTGTKVWAAGSGTISFIGRQRGYGKVIYIKHGKKYMTVYGHLNGFRKGLKKGSKVSQGDIIGYVGQTGLATGPHLHYEFRIKGKHVDPLKHTLPPPAPIAGKELIRFQTFAEPLLHELDLLRSPKMAAQDEDE